MNIYLFIYIYIFIWQAPPQGREGRCGRLMTSAWPYAAATIIGPSHSMDLEEDLAQQRSDRKCELDEPQIASS